MLNMVVTKVETVQKHLLCLVHPLDPRGQKIGGIETHVRLLLRRAPPSSRILFIGVDGIGDLVPGRISQITFDGRTFDFLPVIRFDDSHVHAAAKKIVQSQTFRFALGLIRNIGTIRKALAGHKATIELERYEFSSILAPLGYPVVQVIHGEGSKNEAMDSLIKKYWFIHRFNEVIATRLAAAIVCVNPAIKEKMKRSMPKARKPIVFMPVPVDDALFSEHPFDTQNSVFRVVFVGRLDQFKDPATMFRALRVAWERSNGALEFHYIGTSDPHRYPEFEDIESFTVRHGFRTQPEIVELVARCHCGILTSFFEGMPCFLLETLSIGRPFVAIRLPQYDLVIEPGVSGYMVEREGSAETLEARLADRLLKVWHDIGRAAILPAKVRAKAAPFASDVLLSNHFDLHRSLAR